MNFIKKGASTIPIGLMAMALAIPLAHADEGDTGEAFGLRFNVGTKAEACLPCHAEEHDEWLNGPSESVSELELITGETVRGTMHAYAWQDKLFRIEYEHMGEPEACRRCHMPTTAYSAHNSMGIYAPESRSMALPNYNEGVTCVTCHIDENGVLRGPLKRREEVEKPSPHQVIEDPNMTEASFCSACHDDRVMGALTRTYTEYMQSPIAGEVNCQNCHMPENRHIWPGGHNTDMVSKALDVKVPQALFHERTLTVSFENNGAGHNVPTGEALRGYVVSVEVEDRHGDLVFFDEVVIAPPIRTPIYKGEEVHTRLDPIEPQGTRDLHLGRFEPGLYTVTIEANYQLEREVTLIYWNGETRLIEATADQPVLDFQQEVQIW